jgi:hypothetical protein
MFGAETLDGTRVENEGELDKTGLSPESYDHVFGQQFLEFAAFSNSFSFCGKVATGADIENHLGFAELEDSRENVVSGKHIPPYGRKGLIEVNDERLDLVIIQCVQLSLQGLSLFVKLSGVAILCHFKVLLNLRI